jgi:fumarate hydratase subunit beta
MNKLIKITLPLSEATVRDLRVGDIVKLSGVLYTARDAAHRRLCELVAAGKELPVDLKDETIYFVGPTPAKPGEAIGSAGPTTSYRMDDYSPTLIKEVGIRGMIGKGDRSSAVVAAMQDCGAVYFAGTGGAGALIAKSIIKCEVVCYADLGPEAIHRLEVKDFPVTVAIDTVGGNLYQATRGGAQ